MITKVVLGVALVLIEFTITSLSQNNSLSSYNDTFSIAKFSNISDFTTMKNYEDENDSNTTKTTTTMPDGTEFKLPENCSSYKVS